MSKRKQTGLGNHHRNGYSITNRKPLGQVQFRPVPAGESRRDGCAPNKLVDISSPSRARTPFAGNSLDNLNETNRGATRSDVGVGYRRPPVHSRFKPGQSGNPRGRRRGVRNFKTDLNAALKIPVKVTHKGKPRRISTQEAMILRLREKALSGVTRELLQLIGLAQVYNNEDVPEVRNLSANDEVILQIFKARVLSGAAGIFDSAEECGRSADAAQSSDETSSSGEATEALATDGVVLRRRSRSIVERKTVDDPE